MKKTADETFASPSYFFPAERLLAYRVANQVLTEVARISRGWHGRSGLRTQALDAAESVVLNLGEGAARAQALSPVDELEAARMLAARSAALVGGLVRSATLRRR